MSSPASHRLRWPLLAVLTLAGCVAAAHGLGWTSPFHYDDKPEILLNPNLAGLGHWRDLWLYNPFRFLLLSSFSLQYNTTGIETWPFHLVNLLIHTANAVLVMGLATRLLRADGGGAHVRAAALFSAALFAVHPLLVEGVTYISGRSSSLATTFYLSALLVMDDILRRQAGAVDHGARFRAVARRASLLLSLAIAVALVGAVATAMLIRHDVVDPVRAVFVGLGAALLAAGASSLVVRRILASTLPTGPPAGPLLARWAVLATLFLTGAMVKEIIVTLPVALWLWELCVHHRGRLRPALRTLVGFHLPLVSVPLAIAVFRFAYYGALFSPDMLRSPWINLWTEAEVVWRYLWLFVWPVGLSVFHDHPESVGPATWPTWLALTGWVAVIAASLAGLRRRPVLAFVALWTLVALSPTSSILPLKETMAEHRAYLPATVWCALPSLLALPLARGWGRWLLALLAMVTVLALGLRAVNYTELWQSEEALWTNAVERNPEAAEAWYMLGDIARAERRLDAASERYKRCLEIDPDYFNAANNLGLVYAERREYERAYQRFLQARSIADRLGTCYPAAHNNIARVLAIRANYHDAAAQFRLALACDPESYVAHVGLGDLFYGPLQSRSLALKHYRTAVRLFPGHPTSDVLRKRIEELSW